MKFHCPPIGAYINAQTDETQETALTLACCGGFLEVVQLLAEKGVCLCLYACVRACVCVYTSMFVCIYC